MTIEAVFLDRDGVINEHIPGRYATSPELLLIQQGVGAAIRRWNEAGLPVIIISNQQGVGKGLMTLAELDAVDAAMRVRLLESDGAEITRSYYCTHLKSDGCYCRKPKGGQLRKAAADYSVDLAKAIFVGDSPTDIQAGKDAPIGHSALVLSGATRSYRFGDWPVDPDSVHRDLTAVADWVFSNNSR